MLARQLISPLPMLLGNKRTLGHKQRTITMVGELGFVVVL